MNLTFEDLFVFFFLSIPHLGIFISLLKRFKRSLGGKQSLSKKIFLVALIFFTLIIPTTLFI